MENLPLEIGLEILSRLPIASLIRLKSVSKSLRSVAENPRLRPLYLAHASRRDPSILLHSHGGQLHRLVLADDATNAVLIRIGDDQDFTKLAPAGSCNGFLLLCNSDAAAAADNDTTSSSSSWSSAAAPPVCLWNPLTGHQIQLPPAPTAAGFPEPLHAAVGLGPDPTTSAPKIVRILYYNRPTMFGFVWTSQVQVLTVGGAWREMGRSVWNLKPGPSEATLQLANTAALHWLTLGLGQGSSSSAVKIVSFDLREEMFREIAFPATCFEGLGRDRYTISHLAELSGRLSAVVSGPPDHEATTPLEVWAMKEYGVKESWARDFVIGNHHLPPSLMNPTSYEGGAVRVLCRIRSNTTSTRVVFLVQFARGGLASYCPENQELKELVVVPVLPRFFSAALHLESM
ncbi:unnamed protein product [Linum trigynum]|uniref:F-box domain-containing protein n=1 Tax=Linum trigynum TaxID=586398 RepID=A0AAV2DHJ4_9ROSI